MFCPGAHVLKFICTVLAFFFFGGENSLCCRGVAKRVRCEPGSLLSKS